MPLAPLDGKTEAAWQELAAGVEAPPFLYPGWVKAWSSSFSDGRLALFTTSEGGELAAALPLSVSRLALRSPTNWHTPEFGIVARSDEAATALLDELMASGRSRIDLGFLRPAGAQAFLATAAAGGRTTVSWVQQESPYLPITSDWATYLATRDKRWLRKLRRRRERLEAAGRVVVEVHDGRNGLDSLLEQGFAVEGSGWKGSAGTSVLSSRQTRDFYWQIADWAARQGWLRLAFLRLDDKVVAFNFGLEEAGRYYSVKSGMDETLKQLGPGILLRYELIQRCFEGRLESYEMLGAYEPWKGDWTDKRRPLHRVMAFDRSIAGRTAALLNKRARPAAKELVRVARSLRHRSGGAGG
jgi:CelD/BcsL family acetyltransferase involved in cellulose biosynthesis